MTGTRADASAVVKAGMARICTDFGEAIAASGFAATRRGARSWSRTLDGRLETIQLQRSGASYGAPFNYSISLRPLCSLTRADGTKDALVIDQQRDGRGYCYHLRFNASTWSTYERCLEDLVRATRDVGLPWFAEAA